MKKTVGGEKIEKTREKERLKKKLDLLMYKQNKISCNCNIFMMHT